MKKRLTAALVMCALTIPTAAAAQNAMKQLNVSYDVNLKVNGVPAKMTDAAGKTVEPFVYDGTTYVPLRGVSQLLGAEIGYDASTKTATIKAETSPAPSAQDDDLAVMQAMYLDAQMSSVLQSAVYQTQEMVLRGTAGKDFAQDTFDRIVNCTQGTQDAMNNCRALAEAIIPYSPVQAELKELLSYVQKVVDLQSIAFASYNSFVFSEGFDDVSFARTLECTLDQTSYSNKYLALSKKMTASLTR